jgi:uncharacterized protein (DUF302 family)
MQMMKLITVERFNIVSSKPFEDVTRGLYKGIGRPDMGALQKEMASAATFEEYERVIHAAVGASDLMEFLRLDLGAAIAKGPGAKVGRMVRIIAGNPLIMRQMAMLVPDAGSYAPVTILVYESGDKVHLCYDSMASLLASYGSDAALDVARSLDAKVVKLLNEAAG